MINVSDLIASLRLDDVDTDEKILLNNYLAASEAYIKDAVGANDDFFKDNSDLYRVAVLALAGSYYQNPTSTVVSGSMKASVVNINLVLGNIVTTLRGRWEVSQDGTANESSTPES